MAKQSGIIKFKGTIDDLTFYQTADGFLVRRKTRVNVEKRKSDPLFARTRENNAEFALAAQASLLLRRALRPVLIAGGRKLSASVTKLMLEIRKFDTSGTRGERSAAVGLTSLSGRELLKRFNFNQKSELENVLQKEYSVNSTTGVITIANLTPKIDLKAPASASHVVLKGAWLKVDFANGISSIEQTNVVNLTLNSASGNVTLTPAAVPGGTGTEIFVLSIEFMQEVNGVQYPLSNGEFNCMKLIEVL